MLVKKHGDVMSLEYLTDAIPDVFDVGQESFPHEDRFLLCGNTVLSMRSHGLFNFLTGVFV